MSVSYHISDRMMRHTMRHEISHAKYQDMVKNSPEKIKRWQNQNFRRAAPTDYSGKFRKRWKNFVFKGEDYFKEPPSGLEGKGELYWGAEGRTPEEAIQVRKNIETRKKLYFNELHSEVSAAMYGVSGSAARGKGSSGKDVSKKMAPIIDSYKELYDI